MLNDIDSDYSDNRIGSDNENMTEIEDNFSKEKGNKTIQKLENFLRDKNNVLLVYIDTLNTQTEGLSRINIFFYFTI